MHNRYYIIYICTLHTYIHKYVTLNLVEYTLVHMTICQICR